MIAAQAAARAHHQRELERAFKEENLRRSQLHVSAEGPAETEIEPYVPVPDYLLNVPLKDHDSEKPDVDVSNLLGFLNPSNWAIAR